MIDYKVGDEIRVFEVQKGHYENSIHGSHIAEVKDRYFGNKYGVNLYHQLTDNLGYKFYVHANIDNGIVNVNHIKHVATMRITKLKQKEDKQ